MTKVALVIIYNHSYIKNIAILDVLYKDRFDCIYHLVPFYKGDQKNVIPVYENGQNFHGYIAQSYKDINSESIDHYFFIADDLLLNPAINQYNYQDFFSLSRDASFIPSLTPLHLQDSSSTHLQFHREGFWEHNWRAVNWKLNADGAEIQAQLPSIQEAKTIFEHYGLVQEPLNFSSVYWRPPSLEESSYKFPLAYPMVCSYSDIFIVSASAMKQFVFYCGVFAASRLWVEIAIPTSLVLSSLKINTFSKDSKRGALWTLAERNMLNVFQNNLNLLMNNFPEGYIYLHPIKLSQWNIYK